MVNYLHICTVVTSGVPNKEIMNISFKSNSIITGILQGIYTLSNFQKSFERKIIFDA